MLAWFKRAREMVGALWGATTTVTLAVGGALMAVKADPDFAPYLTEVTAMFPWLPKAIAIAGLTAAVLRLAASPPPKV